MFSPKKHLLSPMYDNILHDHLCDARLPTFETPTFFASYCLPNIPKVPREMTRASSPMEHIVNANVYTRIARYHQNSTIKNYFSKNTRFAKWTSLPSPPSSSLNLKDCLDNQTDFLDSQLDIADDKKFCLEVR